MGRKGARMEGREIERNRETSRVLKADDDSTCKKHAHCACV